MKKQEIKNLIADEAENVIVPDMWASIQDGLKNKTVEIEGCAIIDAFNECPQDNGMSFANDNASENSIKKQCNRKKIFGFAFSGAALVVAFIFVFSFVILPFINSTESIDTTVAAIVSIDINPSLELSINSNDIIVDYNLICDDAKGLMRNQTILYQQLSTVLEIFAQRATAYNFLSVDNPFVLLSVDTQNSELKTRIEESSSNSLSRAAQNFGLNLDLNFVEVNDEIRELANTFEMSVARMSLILDAFNEANYRIADSELNLADFVNGAQNTPLSALYRNTVNFVHFVDGVNVVAITSVVSGETGTISLPKLENRRGEIFVGWRLGDLILPYVLVIEGYAITENLVLTAVWQKYQIFTLTFIVLTYQFTLEISELELTNATGYLEVPPFDKPPTNMVLIGWNVIIDGTLVRIGENIPLSIIDSDMSFMALWSAQVIVR